MFRSLVPSRAGFALALTALPVPIAIGWVSTVVSHTTVAQATADDEPASHRSTAPRDGNRVDRSAVAPSGIALLPRAWCWNGSGGVVGTVTCQIGKP